MQENENLNETRKRNRNVGEKGINNAIKPTSAEENNERVKKTGINLLSYLLLSLDAGHTRKMICQERKMSNQLLGYYIHGLKAKGFIEQTEKQPYAMYKLTPLGDGIKKYVGHSADTKKPIWKCHNLIVGFRIEDYGNFVFNKKIWKEMNGWHFQKIKIEDYNINIQDTGLLKIYCSAEFSTDPATTWARMYEKAQKIAKYISESNGMKIKPMQIIREGQKSLLGSDKLGELIGHVNLGDVWVDASDGTRELEERQNTYGIESLLEMPKKMNELVKIAPETNRLLNEFALNLKLHLEVLNKIGAAIDELSATLKNKEVKP